jgi:hypothetical protein
VLDVVANVFLHKAVISGEELARIRAIFGRPGVGCLVELSYSSCIVEKKDVVGVDAPYPSSKDDEQYKGGGCPTGGGGGG